MTLENSAIRVTGCLYEEKCNTSETSVGRSRRQVRVVSCALSLTMPYDSDKT